MADPIQGSEVEAPVDGGKHISHDKKKIEAPVVSFHGTDAQVGCTVLFLWNSQCHSDKEQRILISQGPIVPETVKEVHVLPQHRKPHDPTVSFAEYRYYAKISRAEEDENSKTDIGDSPLIAFFLPPKNLKGDVVDSTGGASNGEKINNGGEGHSNGGRAIHDLEGAERLGITDDEWTNASRAMRTATWAAVFYLITTDILGPFNVP